MKVCASVSAIGLSMAYFATACSSEPPTDNGYTPPTGGTANTAGKNGMSGSATAGTSGVAGMPSTGGTPGVAGTPGAGGIAGSATAGAGGSGTPGTCPEGVLGHCKAGETYPTYEGYTLALVEDFEAPLDLNSDPIWTWSDGSPQDGQTAFREEQIEFDGGYMKITAESPCAAKTTNSACIPGYASHGEAFHPNSTKQLEDMGVWSGELRTKYNNYRYGRYEVKLAAPQANPNDLSATNQSGVSGNFLSTMFVFRTPKNVDWNEIDIELEPWIGNAIAGNVVNAKGATGYPGGANFDVLGGGDFSIYDEHVYAFTWTPTGIEWFVDGVSVHSFAGTPEVPIPSLSTKIMMNLWVFSGTTFGDAANNQYPFTAKYDWFRFYKLDTETTYPCAPTPGCLPDADKTSSSQNNPKEMSYGK
jgi:hypothetical protein